MKQKKIKTNAENENIRQWQKRFALGRRKAEREKRRENAELERKEIFARKTSGASDKKAPVTLRTRGYYRFTKEYPSAVDENGFRENAPGKKAVLRRRITAAVLCVAAFVCAFVFARSCMLISGRELPSEPTREQGDSEKTLFRALHFSYDEFSSGDTAAMTEKLKELSCTAAVFDFKDDTGYVLFNTGDFMGMSADKRISGAADTVKAVKAAGYEVCAYISCFKDTAASRADLTFSVRKNTYEGDAWLDNSGHGWLDPFSEPARNYVTELITAAAETGFDRIILGNVCFPSDSGTAPQCFAWESSYTASRNQILINFIGSAVKSSGSARLTVMFDHTAFSSEQKSDEPGYYGSMLSCAASSLCIDARLSCQQKNITVGKETFSDASLMPYVFVLAVSEYAENAVTESEREVENENGELLVCIENGPSMSEELLAAELSGADGCIIW